MDVLQTLRTVVLGYRERGGGGRESDRRSQVPRLKGKVK
jgi:hypothetical protein